MATTMKWRHFNCGGNQWDKAIGVGPDTTGLSGWQPLVEWRDCCDAAETIWPEERLSMGWFLFQERAYEKTCDAVFWHFCPKGSIRRVVAFAVMHRLCECEVPDAIRLRAEMRCMENGWRLLG